MIKWPKKSKLLSQILDHKLFTTVKVYVLGKSNNVFRVDILKRSFSVSVWKYL